MNHKKLLIATFATVFSGMILASEVTILPHPYPIEETIDYTKLALQACEEFGHNAACSELKALIAEAQATINQTGTFNWTPEEEARKEACIQAILGQIQERSKIFEEKIQEAPSILGNTIEKTHEAARDLAEKLIESGNKHE